jgi:pyruvyltransferase
MISFQQTRRFDNLSLVPAVWRDRLAPGIPYVFNPSIIAHGDEFVLAYRVVLADGQRHIALCRLDKNLVPRPGSIVPFTETLNYAVETAGIAAPRWAADPRLTWLGSRLYVNFNSGWDPQPNHIYLAEVDPDTLLPLDAAREVVRKGRRRSVEKNWMFFSHDNTVYVVYQYAPLEILKADLSQPDRVMCEPAFLHHWTAWPYEQPYGELRGSASPVRHRDRLYLLAHSAMKIEPCNSLGDGQKRRYVAAMVALAAEPPFAPLAVSMEPLLMLNSAERSLPIGQALNPTTGDSLYASGAAPHDGGLLVSYGISDQYAAVRHVAWDRIEANLVPAIPVAARTPSHYDISSPTNIVQSGPTGTATLRAYWWREQSPLPNGAGDNPTANQSNRFVHGNFGDMVVPYLLRRLTGLPPVNCSDGVRLLTVGSVLQTARDGDVIWGTGVKGAAAGQFRTPAKLHVHATRGPITLDFLRRQGVDVSRVVAMFDPAVLIPHLYAAEVAVLRQQAEDTMQDVLVIPHFADDAVMRKLYPAYEDRILAADTPLLGVIARILRAGLVVSSSLHGLILAEALGVPAVWHRPLMGEDELKYHDYYLGTGRYRIVRVDTLRDAFTVAAMPLPAFDVDAMLASFPSPEELIAYGLIDRRQTLRPGRLIGFSSPLPAGLEALSGWSAPEPHGRWNDGDVAEFAIDVGEYGTGGLCCEWLLSGYLPRQDAVQRISVSDGTSDPVVWTIDRAGEKLFRFPLRADAAVDGKIVLTFRFPDAVSPESLGKANDRRRLAVALKAFRIRLENLALTDDPLVHLAVSGAVVPSESVASGVYRFALDEVTGPVLLLTRVSHVMDRLTGETELGRHDPRALGIAVERIAIRRDASTDDLAAGDPRLIEGWWPAETIGDCAIRWTNGAAVLPVAPGGPVTIELFGVRSARYAPEVETGSAG